MNVAGVKKKLSGIEDWQIQEGSLWGSKVRGVSAGTRRGERRGREGGFPKVP